MTKQITLSEHMSRIKRAYWATQTPEQRTAAAKRAVAAREAKRAAKKAATIPESDAPRKRKVRKPKCEKCGNHNLRRDESCPGCDDPAEE